MLGGAARNPLLKELITPGVHLQESDTMLSLRSREIHLNNKGKMIDFLLVRKSGRKLGSSTTSLGP